jgi:hypothetical protein
VAQDFTIPPSAEVEPALRHILVCATYRYGLPGCLPPLHGSDWNSQPSWTFTLRLSTGRSPFPSLNDYNSGWISFCRFAFAVDHAEVGFFKTGVQSNLACTSVRIEKAGL